MTSHATFRVKRPRPLKIGAVNSAKPAISESNSVFSVAMTTAAEQVKALTIRTTCPSFVETSASMSACSMAMVAAIRLEMAQKAVIRTRTTIKICANCQAIASILVSSMWTAGETQYVGPVR